jgi:intracellular septation protein
MRWSGAEVPAYHPSRMTEAAAPQKSKALSGASQLAVDLGPIAVFVISYNVLLKFAATKDNAVFIATGLFIAATLAAMAWCKIKRGMIPPVLIVVGVLVVIFGGLTIVLHDDTYIKVKPTILYGFYVLAIAGSLLMGQNIWKLFFKHTFNLPDRIWTILAWRWCGFFLFMGLVNEYMRLTLNTTDYINFRPFVVYPLFILFGALNTPMVLKHHIDEEDEATTAEAEKPKASAEPS